MTARLAAGVEVSALIRRIEGLGGTAAVLARGDATAGAILLYVAERGRFYGLLERRLDAAGTYRWARREPQDMGDSREIDAYMRRRRGIDPDLWIVELDIVGAERFTAEMIATG